MPKVVQIKNSKYIRIPEEVCLIANISKGQMFNITLERSGDILMQKIK